MNPLEELAAANRVRRQQAAAPGRALVMHCRSFRIMGVNKYSGDDVTVSVEAPDRRGAEDWAARNGIMWESVTLEEDPVASVPASIAVCSPPNGPNPAQRSNSTAPSGFGIGALALGVVACVFCWVPLLGALSIPIGGIGLILALVGLAVSLVGRRSGVGMPVAGGVACLLAIAIAGIATGGAVWAMNRATGQMARNTQNSSPAGTPSGTDAPRQGDDNDAAPWTPVTSGIRCGNAQLRVVAAHVDSDVWIPNSDGTAMSVVKLLFVKLEIANTSQTSKMQLRLWGAISSPFETSCLV